MGQNTREEQRLTSAEIWSLMKIGILALGGLVLFGVAFVLGGTYHMVLRIWLISVSQFLVLTGTGTALTPAGTWLYAVTEALRLPSWRELYERRWGVYWGWIGTIGGAVVSVGLEPVALASFPRATFILTAALALAISVGGRAGTIGNAVTSQKKARAPRTGSIWRLIAAIVTCLMLTLGIIFFLIWPSVSLARGYGYQGLIPIPLPPFLTSPQIQSVSLGVGIGSIVAGFLDALLVQTVPYQQKMPRGKGQWTVVLSSINWSTLMVLLAYLVGLVLGNTWAGPYRAYGDVVARLMLAAYSTPLIVVLNNVLKVGILNLLSHIGSDRNPRQ